MFAYSQKWKKITLEEYNRKNRGLDNLGMLFSGTKKQLKDSVFDKIQLGNGILNYIEQYDELLKQKYSEDDYDYYKEDGTELIFMGGEESIKQMKKFLNLK